MGVAVVEKQNNCSPGITGPAIARHSIGVAWLYVVLPLCATSHRYVYGGVPLSGLGIVSVAISTCWPCSMGELTTVGVGIATRCGFTFTAAKPDVAVRPFASVALILK